MPSLRFIALAGLAVLSNVASAATDVKLLKGVCSNLPNAVRLPSGQLEAPDVLIQPLTGTYLDTTRRFAWITKERPGLAPLLTLSAYNDTGYASLRVDCTNEDGLYNHYNTSETLKINTDQDATVSLGEYGFTPEPYAYYVDGQRQPGVYLGLAGVVSWAWTPVEEYYPNTGRTLLNWVPRLRVATDGDTQNSTQLRQGEIAGFLVVIQSSDS